MSNFHFTQKISSPESNANLEQRRQNKLISMECKAKKESCLSVTPIFGSHPSAKNLIVNNLKKKPKQDLIQDININSNTNSSINQPTQSKKNSYHLEINQIEEKVYCSKNDTFWMKNTSEISQSEVLIAKEKPGEKTNIMTAFQKNLDKIITEAIQNNRNYEVIERAIESSLKEDKN